MTIPVEFNEPISMLQKISEIMEYEEFLVKANNEQDPQKRYLYIIAFSIAQYKTTEFRLSKPFNPILGETFEIKNKKFLYFSEQVSHHPPISACYAKARNGEYEYWMNSYMKTNFWGASIYMCPLGLIHIKLKDHNEIYSI